MDPIREDVDVVDEGVIEEGRGVAASGVDEEEGREDAVEVAVDAEGSEVDSRSGARALVEARVVDVEVARVVEEAEEVAIDYSYRNSFHHKKHCTSRSDQMNLGALLCGTLSSTVDLPPPILES